MDIDINTKINIISKVILPLVSLLGGFIGFWIGIFKQRNDIKWKENREALQCAYACCVELKRSISKNFAINTELINELKFNKYFNIKKENIRNKVYEILEYSIVDSATMKYIDDKKADLIKLIDEVLPLLLKELK